MSCFKAIIFQCGYRLILAVGKGFLALHHEDSPKEATAIYTSLMQKHEASTAFNFLLKSSKLNAPENAKLRA